MAAVSSWKVLDTVENKALQDFAASGQHFALKGTIADKSIEEWLLVSGGWKIETTGKNGWTFRLEGDNVPFILEKRWFLSEDLPWRIRFDVCVKAKKNLPQPQLALFLGPGIGEQSVSGLGVAESLYSYTELVYKKEKDIKILRFNGIPGESKKLGNLNVRWIGLHSRYFALILFPHNHPVLNLDTTVSIPQPDETRLNSVGTDLETNVSLLLPFYDLKKGETQILAWDVFGGGKSYDALKKNGIQGLLYNNLWTWMRWLISGIGHILYGIQLIVSNWGTSIILLACVIRIVIHPLARWAMKAQKEFTAIQKKIQPEIREIKRGYKGAEQSERILQVYERYKISPLAGLKPLLVVAIQIPIFMALFHLLGQAFELRDTSFLWIRTLAEPDKLFHFGVDLPYLGSYFNFLPLLMSLTNLLTIKITPSPTEVEGGWFKRNFFMIIMTLAFFLLFYSFPAGMVLYWTAANILQLTYAYWSHLSSAARS